MKVMYIDVDIVGHHQAYLSELLMGCHKKVVVVLPQKVGWIAPTIKQYIYSPVNLVKKNLFTYIRWIREILGMVRKENPDIVHFLYGDVFYKYFGLGLSGFSKYKTVMTMHWVRPSRIQKCSLRCMCKRVDMVIVHSSYLLNEISRLGIKNSAYIEYPQFKRGQKIDQNNAKAYWGLKQNVPVIVSLGSTRKRLLIRRSFRKRQNPIQIR